jgi:hypothetical protein
MFATRDFVKLAVARVRVLVAALLMFTRSVP